MLASGSFVAACSHKLATLFTELTSKRKVVYERLCLASIIKYSGFRGTHQNRSSIYSSVGGVRR